MTSPAYSERLMAQLDGAKLVRYDAAGLLYAWYGAHGVHAYDAAGTEVDYWTCGSYADDDASLEEVEASMAARIRNVDAIVEQAEEQGYEARLPARGYSTVTRRRLLHVGSSRGSRTETLRYSMRFLVSPIGEWADAPLPRDVLEGLGLMRTTTPRTTFCGLTRMATAAA